MNLLEAEALSKTYGSGETAVRALKNVSFTVPKGSFSFTVSGFRSNDSQWVGSNGGEDSALLVREGTLGAFILHSTYGKVRGEEKTGNVKQRFYIRFKDGANIRKALAELKEQYGLKESDIKQNSMLMATMGPGDSAAILRIYGVAVFLFILVMLAGIFMIAGSRNSNIAQRSQFFGMLRCIGTSKKQVMHIVRMEALNWCKSAIPLGVLAGCAGTWGLCAVLKYAGGGEFRDMEVFHLSFIGVVCGALLGLVTVLMAAQSPAKRAARVSPAAAVSGNAGQRCRKGCGGEQQCADGLRRGQSAVDRRHGLHKRGGTHHYRYAENEPLQQ